MERMKIEVANPKEAEAVQKILFDMGYSWIGGGKTFFKAEKRYFYTESNGEILWGDDESYFKQVDKYKKFSLEYNPKLVEETRETIRIGEHTYYKDEFEKAVANLKTV